MKTFPGLLATWLILLGLTLSSGCSQRSSEIEVSRQQPDNSAIVDLEELIDDDRVGTLKPSDNEENRIR